MSSAARFRVPGAATHLKRMLGGAALGALLAGVFIVIGLLRLFAAFVIAALGEARPNLAAPTWRDVQPLAFYVLGFALAGAFVGLLMPWLRRAVAMYAAMAVGGMLVMTMIMASDKGLHPVDRRDWVFIILFGALFGGAAAWGWRRGTTNARWF
jgi:hypothetical protein